MLLALRPGQGLGPFLLGHTLPQVLGFLQRHKADYRCVEIKYSEKDTLQRDILVSFPEHGFQLLFDPRSQRLRLVEVFDATRLQVVYGRTAVFGGASNAPTFGRIYEAFGPTYPGEPDAEGLGGYPLQYPGILFLFPHAAAYQQQQQLAGHSPPAGLAAGYGAEGPGRANPSFPVPLGAVAERMFIHAGTRGPPAAVLASPPPPLGPGSPYMEPIEAVPSHGLYFGANCGAAVRFGDSPQDVVSKLGQPARVVRKAGGAAGASALPDYFYCYPWRGVDLLFDGSSHRLTKAVLHTNVPGHPDFNAYCKANFRVHQSGWRPAQVGRQLHTAEEAGGFHEDGKSDGEQPAGERPPLLQPPAGAEVNTMALLAAPSVGPPASGAAVTVGIGAARQDAGVGPDAGPAAEAQPQQPGTARAGERAAEGAAAPHGAQQGGGTDGGEPGEDGKAAGGLSAAYQMLVGLIDDVMTLDPQKLSPEEAAAGGGELAGAEQQEGAAAGGAGSEEAPAGEGSAGAEAEVEAAAAAPAAAAAAVAGGKPPKPPAAAATPPPAPAVAIKAGGGSKKKKGKKKRAAAAAAAAAQAASAEQQEESDSMADASASDSGFESSSLPSSPGLTSHFVGPPGRRLGLANGYQSSDWGSTADLAAKEGSVAGGSALDGWSDADDLFPMIAGQSSDAEGPAVPGAGAGGSPRAGSGAAAPGPQAGEEEEGMLEGGTASLAAWAVPPAATGAGAAAASALTAALSASQGGGPAPQQQQQQQKQLVSAGVQTRDVAVGCDEVLGSDELSLSGAGLQLADLDAAGAGAWEGESGSPNGYVIPDRPSLVDEGVTSEYERVPRQRDCSTQTPASLLSPPRAAGAGGSGGSQRWGGGGSSAASGAAAQDVSVTCDSRLEEIEAAFGHQGGPALHNRLGASHPFGPSYLYAFRGVVFEVLQSGLIATVTLFKA